MKVFIFVMIVVTLQNIAQAETPEERFRRCVQEQMEIIDENKDSYTAEEIDEQIVEAPEYCKEN